MSIDCSEKYEDRFYKFSEQTSLEAALRGKVKRGAMLNGKEFRSLIADIEERGFIYKTLKRESPRFLTVG